MLFFASHESAHCQKYRLVQILHQERHSPLPFTTPTFLRTNKKLIIYCFQGYIWNHSYLNCHTSPHIVRVNVSHFISPWKKFVCQFVKMDIGIDQLSSNSQPLTIPYICCELIWDIYGDPYRQCRIICTNKNFVATACTFVLSQLQKFSLRLPRHQALPRETDFDSKV